MSTPQLKAMALTAVVMSAMRYTKSIRACFWRNKIRCIPVAAPFALSDLISSDLMQVLIKLGRLP